MAKTISSDHSKQPNFILSKSWAQKSVVLNFYTLCSSELFTGSSFLVVMLFSLSKLWAGFPSCFFRPCFKHFLFSSLPEASASIFKSQPKAICTAPCWHWPMLLFLSVQTCQDEFHFLKTWTSNSLPHIHSRPGLFFPSTYTHFILLSFFSLFRYPFCYTELQAVSLGSFAA